jgi:hypothetical protein
MESPCVGHTLTYCDSNALWSSCRSVRPRLLNALLSSLITARSRVVLQPVVTSSSPWQLAQGQHAAALPMATAQMQASPAVWPHRPECALVPTTRVLSLFRCMVHVKGLHARSAVTVWQVCRIMSIPHLTPTTAQLWRACSKASVSRIAHSSCVQHLRRSSSQATGATWAVALELSAQCLVSDCRVALEGYLCICTEHVLDTA